MSRISRKQVTLTSLAQELGVSTATVSYVINGQARQQKISPTTSSRVLKAAVEAGYFPSYLVRVMRVRRTGAIGVIFNRLGGWADSVLLGLQEALDEEGFTIFSSVHRGTAKREMHEVQSMLERRVDAILTMPLKQSRRLYERILQHGPPLVFMGDTFTDMPGVSYVAWDQGPAVGRAIDHLMERGRHRIGLLSRSQDTLALRNLRESFQHALLERDLQTNPAWIIEGEDGELRNGLRRLVRPVLERRTRPDALLAMSDALAVELISILQGMNLRVPQDVSVISLGNLGMAELPGISLTSVQEPCREMGRAAGALAVKLLEKPENAPLSHLISAGQLIIRRTTGG